MLTEFDVIAATSFGIESVARDELIGMGIRNKIFCENGRCIFSGSLEDAVKCCVFSRTVDRVYLRLVRGSATTFDELYELVSSINWNDYIPHDAKISISAKSTGSVLYALSAVQSVTKKAIVRSIARSDTTILPENGADFRLQVSISNDICEVLLDMVGTGLNRRGYRVKTSLAPVKETLAAAILLLSGYNGHTPLFDPFCGSGTFLTEGISIAMNIAPGAERRFALEHYPFIDKRILRTAKEQAKQNALSAPRCAVIGSDIDAKQIELARFHAEKLGVSKHVVLGVADARKTVPPEYSTCVANPPYGERLMSQKAVSALYRDWGENYRRYPVGSSLSVLTACERFEHDFGKRADKNRKLFNGNIPCRIYFYGASHKKYNK